MPRTKAIRAKPKRDRTRSRVTCEPIISKEVLEEVADIEQQWKGRKHLLISSRNDIISVIERQFELAIVNMCGDANLLLQWDSEAGSLDGLWRESSLAAQTEEEEEEEESVTSSMVSPLEAASMTSVSFSSNATSSRSRDPNPVPCTPAMKAMFAFTASECRPLRTSSRLRNDYRLMAPPPTAGPLSRFYTPATNTVADGSRYNQITPKVAPNSSMSVLRRPVQGEMAFAMSGSPLMVSSSNAGDEVANVNLPLGNGRVLSILPMGGFRPRDLPQMSDDTMDQLIKLRNNLESIIAEDPRSHMF